MALYVVATPIGNDEDLSPRARRLLREATLVIGEEHREVMSLLKLVQAPSGQIIELLNEHSRSVEVNELALLCQNQLAVLVTDCGTPGFCDPGAHLVHECRRLNIEVRSVPGPSSLMAFLSVVGHRLDQFQFVGFLPANREDRARMLKQLQSRASPLVLMDTPYRLERLVDDVAQNFRSRQVTVGLNLSTDQERVVTGSPEELQRMFKGQKAEFLMLIHGQKDSSSKPKEPHQRRTFSRKKSMRK